MTPSRSPFPPPPHAGGAADEAGDDQRELVAPSDVWMSGLESPGGGSGGAGAGRAGDDGRRNSLGQSENATLRKIEACAQMEVSEWRPVKVIMQFESSQGRQCRGAALAPPSPRAPPTTMPLHLGTLLAPPQQLDGTDLVAASAARAEELQARWATPPPHAPD